MPVLTERTIKSIYGSGASRYDRAMGTYWEFNRRSLVELLDIKGPCRLLEVGVGTGSNLLHYDADTEVTGIDFTPEMLSVARTKLHGVQNSRCRLLEMDARRMVFADNAFDAALESFSLCVTPDVVSVLFEILRVTKPGARFAVYDYCVSSNPNTVKWQELIATAATTIGFPPGVIVWDPLRDYAEIIRKATIPFEIAFFERHESDNPFLIACKLVLVNRKQ